MKRVVSLFSIAAIGWGCTTVRLIDTSAANFDGGRGVTLAPHEGLVVVHIDTALPIAKLDISQAAAITDLPKGEHLLLLVVSKGSHRWSDIVISAGEGPVRFRMGGEVWEFRVEAGRTNYPGHITVRGRAGARNVEIRGSWRNRSALALRSLRDRFPQVLERYPPIYTGTGDDHFLAYFGDTFLKSTSQRAADDQ